MRMLSYVFETSLSFSEPVSEHSFVLRCLPKSGSSQKVMESQIFTDPRIHLNELTDGFGNRTCVGYCPQAHDAFDFYASGLAMVAPEDLVEEACHPMYYLQTPLTMPSNEMIAAAKLIEAECPEGDKWLLAQNLASFVYGMFEYAPGTTDTHTTAQEAFEQARGVCQDYSQVLISLCRSAGIAAKYTTGLMKGEGATHAWTEIYDGKYWRGLDPTHDRVVDDCYLTFAHGRDFEDCPIERGVFRGSAEQTQKVSSQVGDDAGAISAEDFE